MKDNEITGLTNDLLVAEVLLRLQSLENLLVDKNILTREELKNELNTVSSKIIKEILKKANVPGNLDDILNSLKSI